jgi:hypothetical protein
VWLSTVLLVWLYLAATNLIGSKTTVPTLLVWWLDPRIESPITQAPYFKAKLSFVFRNESGRAIDVQVPKWSGAALQLETGFGFGYQLEKTKGKADWDENAKSGVPAHVEPGWSVKLWIGLDPKVPHVDLEQKRDQAQLGRLIIPTKRGYREIKPAYHV